MTDHRFCEDKECHGTYVWEGIKREQKKHFECYKCCVCGHELNVEIDIKKTAKYL